jgi:cyclopropane fatty-acyl-phospholipid synthase-like methyltransferase
MSEIATAVAAYYDALVHEVSAKGEDAFTVHRRLVGPYGMASARLVHDHLHAAIRPAPGARLLDAGSGLGGTSFDWHERVGGDTDGLTISRGQVARARAEAARRGLALHCRFHLMSYDADLRALGGFDAVVAIESLAHAADPAATIANLAGALRPGGRLAIVDDLPAADLAADDRELVAFRAGWLCAHSPREDEIAPLIARAGLTLVHEEDLTPLVARSTLADIEQRERATAARRAVCAPAFYRLLDGIRGGLMLERLYRRGVMRYRLIVAAASA